MDFVFQRYKPGLSNFCPPKTFARFARRQAKSRVTVDLPRILLFTWHSHTCRLLFSTTDLVTANNLNRAPTQKTFPVFDLKRRVPDARAGPAYWTWRNPSARRPEKRSRSCALNAVVLTEQPVLLFGHRKNPAAARRKIYTRSFSVNVECFYRWPGSLLTLKKLKANKLSRSSGSTARVQQETPGYFWTLTVLIKVHVPQRRDSDFSTLTLRTRDVFLLIKKGTNQENIGLNLRGS